MSILSVPVSRPLQAEGKLCTHFSSALLFCSQAGSPEGAGVGLLGLWPSCHLTLRLGNWLCSWLPCTPVLDLLLCPLRVEIILGWESCLGLTTNLAIRLPFCPAFPRSSLSGRLNFFLLFGSILLSTPVFGLILGPDPTCPSASRALRPHCDGEQLEKEAMAWKAFGSRFTALL